MFALTSSDVTENKKSSGQDPLIIKLCQNGRTGHIKLRKNHGHYGWLIIVERGYVSVTAIIAE